MAGTKQFIGRVEVKETKYGELIKISLGSKDRELLQQTANAKGWNNLVLKKGKEGKYYIEVDQYEPGAQANGSGSGNYGAYNPGRPIADELNDLPF